MNPMSVRKPFLLLVPILLALSSAEAESQTRNVDLKAQDGTLLKATYFAAAKPGPGVLLLHQCNRDRKSWDALAQSLTSVGISVLTIDNRGFGESGGMRFDKLTPDERQKLTTEIWPGDFDVAFQYLLSQPGVQPDKIGAGGASCGVNNSIQLARRHPEVKALMLLSGPTDRNGRLFLERTEAVPLFAAAAGDDTFGNLSLTVQ
jgi:dienelactone hydrolase